MKAATWNTTARHCSGTTKILVEGARDAAIGRVREQMLDSTLHQPMVEYFFWGNPKDSRVTGYHGAFKDPADDGTIDHLFLVQFEGHSSDGHFSTIVHEAAHHAFPGMLTEDDIAAVEKCVTRNKKKEREMGGGGGCGSDMDPRTRASDAL